MRLRNAVFDPAQIKILQDVHRSAVAALPRSERSSIVQVKLAESILESAAAGETDATRLLTTALVRYRTQQIS